MTFETGPVDRVCEALRRPSSMNELSAPAWDLLVRQARRSDLLARLGCILEAQGSIDTIAQAPRRHLEAAMLVAQAQHAQALRELARIESALAPTGVRPVLLNGCAYVAASLLPAMGRTLTSLDILVPPDKLGDVDAALMLHGWTADHHSHHDQQYPRQWMHKLPPLRHLQRGTVINVHHTIQPGAVRWKSNAPPPSAHAHPIAGWALYAVLDAPDMVLHGMVQLFRAGAFSRSLRDLSDLDLLLRHQGRTPRFWADLLARARDLDLARTLYYGLRYSNLRLGTPVPTDAMQASAADGPGALGGWLSDALWAHALRPQHATATDGITPAALLALRARARWLRTPAARLLRRLAIQALGRREAAAPIVP